MLAQALYFGPTPVDEAIERCEQFLASTRRPLARGGVSEHPRRPARDAGRLRPGPELWAAADKLYEDLGLSFRRAARSLIPRRHRDRSQVDYDAAERELRWGYETLEQMGEKSSRATIAAFLAEAVYKQGRDDEAERLTEISEELAAADDLVTQVSWRSVRAKILARRGEREQAEELGREVVALAANTDFPDLKARHRSILPRCSTRPEGRRSRRARRRARQLYERKGNVAAAPAVRGYQVRTPTQHDLEAKWNDERS